MIEGGKGGIEGEVEGGGGGGGNIIIRIENKEDKNKVRNLVIYADYWVINQTPFHFLFKNNKSNEVLPGQMEYPVLQAKEPSKSPSNPIYFFSEDKISKISMKINNQSEWSDSIELIEGIFQFVSVKEDVSNQFLDLSVKCDSTYRCMFEFSITVSSKSNIYWRSKQILIFPRFILVNQSKYDLHFMQAPSLPSPVPSFSSSSSSFLSACRGEWSTLPANGHIPFHWFDYNLPLLLSIRFNILSHSLSHQLIKQTMNQFDDSPDPDPFSDYLFSLPFSLTNVCSSFSLFSFALLPFPSFLILLLSLSFHFFFFPSSLSLLPLFSPFPIPFAPSPFFILPCYPLSLLPFSLSLLILFPFSLFHCPFLSSFPSLPPFSLFSLSLLILFPLSPFPPYPPFPFFLYLNKPLALSPSVSSRKVHGRGGGVG